MSRILVVEDEEQIRKLLVFNLKDEGFKIVEAVDGKQAISLIDAEHFDLVLLDLMLPYVSGLDVLDHIMIRQKPIPTIILSAKNQTKDRILGLRKGAEDYITKPFDIEELLLRIHNVLQRNQSADISVNHVLSFGNNTVDLKSNEAQTNEGIVVLTKKEIALLKLLHANEGNVVSRQEILQKVWGFDVFPNSRTIDNFLLAFRKYFEIDPKQPKHFLSIRGIGYKFIKEPTIDA